MKVPALLLAILLFRSIETPGQFPNVSGVTPTVPRPPEVEHRPPLDPPDQANGQTQRRRIDPAKARSDAEELAKLAQSIPPEVEMVAKGRLPKDLIEQLRRIEKLSKQLRRELSP